MKTFKQMLNELSVKTIKSYRKKAIDAKDDIDGMDDVPDENQTRRYFNHENGISIADTKLGAPYAEPARVPATAYSSKKNLKSGPWKGHDKPSNELAGKEKRDRNWKYSKAAKVSRSDAETEKERNVDQFHMSQQWGASASDSHNMFGKAINDNNKTIEKRTTGMRRAFKTLVVKEESILEYIQNLKKR
jgi:hypothetical protein